MPLILAVAGVVILELIRRKDVYVLLFLTGLITVLLGSIPIFGNDQIARYLKEICLTLIWVSSIVIALTTAARQIPAERESRTLFPLLAKPISRGQVLLGKFLGCWLASILALGLFYLFFTLISGAREKAWPIAGHLQAFWLHAVFCAIVIALSLLGSLVLAAPSSTITIVGIGVTGILLLGRHLNKVAANAGGLAGDLLNAIYFSIPHLEWYDVRDLVVHRWPPLDASVIAFDTAYGAAFTSLFLLLAWARFRRLTLQ